MINEAKVIEMMRNGHKAHTTYIGKKIITAAIDGKSVDPIVLTRIIDNNTEVFCSYYSKPDLWDEKSWGRAEYSWMKRWKP